MKINFSNLRFDLLAEMAAWQIRQGRLHQNSIRKMRGINDGVYIPGGPKRNVANNIKVKPAVARNMNETYDNWNNARKIRQGV